MKNCRTEHLFLVMKLSSFATNLGLGPHNRVFFSVCELMCVGGGKPSPCYEG